MDRTITYKVNPKILKQELFDFYQENSICEEGYGIDIATRVLSFTSLIVAAFDGDKLIGISRSMFDGVTADLVEFCIGIEYQGQNLEYDNGSIIEKDDFGIAAELGKRTINELLDMGAHFVSTIAFEEAEKNTITSAGFTRNDGHINYVYEKRPYVPLDRHSNDV
ncbi:hypothetical protein EZV73_01775 [Acidaminobacter sp. JC074]|uniref:hypothetical protein n=1 Tax=Acidaminobacter sp. JC074 TaxID=2530199 RepID=UPI001F100385|nr:hypothetical protein [Acidaminobacter sp. JC074]MCH4886274.1 hypothetical protein [Acidaminobacter sp. JC074]